MTTLTVYRVNNRWWCHSDNRSLPEVARVAPVFPETWLCSVSEVAAMDAVKWCNPGCRVVVDEMPFLENGR